MLKRALREILPGLPVIVLLGIILFYFLLVKGANVTLAASAVIVLLIQNYRKDKRFLQYTMGRKRYLIFAIEYSVISLPFLMLLAVQQAWWQIAILVVVIGLSPFMGNTRIGYKLPTHPLYLKGSYNYQRTYRFLLPLHLLLLALCITGCCVDNRNLSFVAAGFWGFLYATSLLTERNREEIHHYASPRRFLSIVLQQAFANTAIVLVPFGLVLICDEASVSMLLHLCAGYVAFSLFALNIELTRMFFSTTSILSLLLPVAAYTAIAIISAIEPWVLFPSLLVPGTLSIVNYHSMKKLIDVL